MGADILMGNVVSIFVFGLSYGLVLFLLASGLTLTMGLMRVVNMSHGAFYMIAGYVGVEVYKVTNSWLLGTVAAAALAALLGLILEVGFLRRLYKHPTYQVLLTIGIINILNNIAQWIWGGYAATAPTPLVFRFSIDIMGTHIPAFRFVIIAFGVIVAILLWFLQDKTRVGAMVRAGMDNGEVAGTLGLNNKIVFTGVFVLGSLVAGVASMFGGTLTGLDMSTSWSVLLNSIIVVVVGGTGSIQGALLGGMIIGIADAFGKVYLPSAFTPVIIYAVLIIILLIKPAGLLGRKVDMNKAADDGILQSGDGAGSRRVRAFWEGDATSNLRTSTRARAHRFTPYIFILLVLAILPQFIGTYTQTIMSKVLIYALFAMSLDVVMGYTGMRSFGHAAYFGLGGYIIAIFAQQFGITSFWIMLPIVIVMCAVLAAILGYFTLRLSGTYFLLVTMAFAQLLRVIAEQWKTVTKGTDGLFVKMPDLGFKISWTSQKFYYLVLIFFVICFFILNRVMRSSFGRSLIGVRENEGRMRSLGFNTWAVKYRGVIIAGIFSGIAGMLYAYAYQTVVPSQFGVETSALPMLMVILGGGATLWGPALGAVVITLVQNYANIYMAERWPLILGIVYVLCVLFLRGGLSPYLANAWNWIGNKVFAKKGSVPVTEKTTGGEE